MTAYVRFSKFVRLEVKFSGPDVVHSEVTLNELTLAERKDWNFARKSKINPVGAEDALVGKLYVRTFLGYELYAGSGP